MCQAERIVYAKSQAGERVVCYRRSSSVYLVYKMRRGKEGNRVVS